MKKRIFSPSLFREFMRQLRLPGLIFTAVMCIEAILVTAEGIISAKGYDAYGNVIYSTVSCRFLSVHPISVLTIFVVAPVLVMCALSFVNKRNASDFYHSLCERRECVFISAFAAAAAWIVISLLSGSAVAVVSHAVFPSIFIFNYASAVVSVFVILSGSLFVASCVAIAMSFTGTFFNNIIMSGILVFLPQSILFAVRTSVVETVSVMTNKGLFGQSYNIPFAVLEKGMFGNVSSVFDSIPHAVYTLAFAIIYFVIAILLFKIRKSEYADNSAVGKKVQAICRVLVGTVFSLIPVTCIFMMSNGGYTADTEDVFFVIVMYIVMIVAVGIYELIATKKFRNLISAAKSLIPIAVINAALIGCMFGAYYGTLAFKPDADDIKSVRIISDSYDNYDYFAAMSDKIELNSNEIKQLVSSTLKSNINDQMNKTYNYSSSTHYTRTVAIKTATGTHYRSLTFTQKQYDQMLGEINKNKDYQKLYLTLPEVNAANIECYYNGNAVLTDSQKAELYKLLKKDIEGMDFSDSYSLLKDSMCGDCYIGNIKVTGPVGTRNYNFYISISEFTPNASNYLISIINESSKDKIDKLADILSNYVFDYEKYYNGEYDYGVDVCVYNVNYEDGTPYDAGIYNERIDFKKLAELVRKNAGKAVTADMPMMSVSCDQCIMPGDTVEDAFSCYIYIPLDSDSVPDFYNLEGVTQTEYDQAIDDGAVTDE